MASPSASSRSRRSSSASRPPLWARLILGDESRLMPKGSGARVWTRKTPRVWALEDAQESGEGLVVRWALDWWRPGATEPHVARLRNHERWAQRLTEAGLATPRVRFHRFLSIGPARMGVVAEDLLTGAELDRSLPGPPREASAFLARLHRLDPGLGGASGKAGPRWIDRSFPAERTGYLSWWETGWRRRLVRCVEQFGASRAGREAGREKVHRRAAGVFEEIDRRVRESLSSSPRWRVCHGDIHPENFRYDAAGTMNLIDLEWVHVGLAEIDLAYVERRLQPTEGGGSREDFLEAYRQAGGEAALDDYERDRGLWLAIHDLRRAASVERKTRRGWGLRARQTPDEWIEKAEQDLNLSPGGKP